MKAKKLTKDLDNIHFHPTKGIIFRKRIDEDNIIIKSFSLIKNNINEAIRKAKKYRNKEE